MGRRHTGGGHEKDRQGQAATSFRHITNAGDTGHVGNLMGIGDNRGDAVGHNGAGKLRRCTEAALNVDMGVDQAGDHIRAAEINRSFALVTIPNPNNHAIIDRHRRPFDQPGKDVDDLSIC